MWALAPRSQTGSVCTLRVYVCMYKPHCVSGSILHTHYMCAHTHCANTYPPTLQCPPFGIMASASCASPHLCRSQQRPPFSGDCSLRPRCLRCRRRRWQCQQMMTMNTKTRTNTITNTATTAMNICKICVSVMYRVCAVKGTLPAAIEDKEDVQHTQNPIQCTHVEDAWTQSEAKLRDTIATDTAFLQRDGITHVHVSTYINNIHISPINTHK